jgi:hypothetical protein
MLTDVHGRDDQADLLTCHGVTAQQVNDHMHLSGGRRISCPSQGLFRGAEWSHLIHPPGLKLKQLSIKLSGGC